MKHSLSRRIILGKTIGFIIGLIGFLSIPFFLPDASLMLRFGVLFWYTILGAMVGIAGVMDQHPVLHFRINAYVRGIIIGASMNFALVLIAFDSMSQLISTATSFTGVSPFLLVCEGAFFGLIIDLLVTKYAGEGPHIVLENDEQ